MVCPGFKANSVQTRGINVDASSLIERPELSCTSETMTIAWSKVTLYILRRHSQLLWAASEYQVKRFQFVFFHETEDEPMKIRALKRELKARGYQLLPKRGKGSHSMWRCDAFTIVLSGKNNQDAQPDRLKLIK